MVIYRFLRIILSLDKNSQGVSKLHINYAKLKKSHMAYDFFSVQDGRFFPELSPNFPRTGAKNNKHPYRDAC